MTSTFMQPERVGYSYLIFSGYGPSHPSLMPMLSDGLTFHVQVIGQVIDEKRQGWQMVQSVHYRGAICA